MDNSFLNGIVVVWKQILLFELARKTTLRLLLIPLLDSWITHADAEPEFINRSTLENSNFEKYFTDCFSGNETSFLLIAEDEGTIAGFIKLSIQTIQSFFNETTVMYIDDIFTMENYRQRSVASLLLRKAHKLAKEKNIKWMKARVYSFNEPAQFTFESAGYKKLYSEYFKILHDN